MAVRELVYSVKHRKWFEIARGVDGSAQSRTLQAGVPVSDSLGNRYTYGAVKDGGHVERLEHGTDMDGAAIAHTMWLSDKALAPSIMYESELTRVKLLAKCNASTGTVTARHYLNGDPTGTAMGTAFTQNVSGKRIYQRKIGTLAALKGDLHSLKFMVSTNDVPCGFEPLAVGLIAATIRQDKNG